MAECLCGCGELTTGKNRFLPGHDQKLRIKFEESIGGIENLLELKGFIDKYGYQALLDIIKSLKRFKTT